MEATLLERGKKYSYKNKKEVTYKTCNLFSRPRYIFLGPQGGEISLSLNQVTIHIKEIRYE